MEVKKKVVSFLGKVKPAIKKTKTFLERINDAIYRLVIFLLSLFENTNNLE